MSDWDRAQELLRQSVGSPDSPPRDDALQLALLAWQHLGLESKAESYGEGIAYIAVFLLRAYWIGVRAVHPANWYPSEPSGRPYTFEQFVHICFPEEKEDPNDH